MEHSVGASAVAWSLSRSRNGDGPSLLLCPSLTITHILFFCVGISIHPAGNLTSPASRDLVWLICASAGCCFHVHLGWHKTGVRRSWGRAPTAASLTQRWDCIRQRLSRLSQRPTGLLCGPPSPAGQQCREGEAPPHTHPLSRFPRWVTPRGWLQAGGNTPS